MSLKKSKGNQTQVHHLYLNYISQFTGLMKKPKVQIELIRSAMETKTISLNHSIKEVHFVKRMPISYAQYLQHKLKLNNQMTKSYSLNSICSRINTPCRLKKNSTINSLIEDSLSITSTNPQFNSPSIPSKAKEKKARLRLLGDSTSTPKNSLLATQVPFFNKLVSRTCKANRPPSVTPKQIISPIHHYSLSLFLSKEPVEYHKTRAKAKKKHIKSRKHFFDHFKRAMQNEKLKYEAVLHEIDEARFSNEQKLRYYMMKLKYNSIHSFN